MGPLGWSALLIFFIARSGDISNLICRVYLGYRLSPEDFGAIDPVFAFLGIFILPVAGLFQIAVKSISRFRALGKNNEYRGLLMDMLVISLVGSIASAIIVLCFKTHILTRLHLCPDVYIYIIASLFVFAWWQQMCLAIFQGTQNYRLMLVYSFLSSISMLGFTFWLVELCSLDLLGAMIAKAVPGIVTGAIIVVLFKGLLSGPKSRDVEEVKLMKTMLLPMNVYLCCISLLSNIATLFVRNFIVEHSGGYGAIATLGVVPNYIITSIVFVIFPFAAAEHAAGREVNRFYKQALIFGSVVTLVSVGTFAVTARPLLLMWNKVFLPYAQYLWLYTLIMGLNGIIQVIASVEMARHRYAFLWCVAIPAVVMTLLLYAWRSSLTISFILTVLVLTHVLILAGIWMLGFLNIKQSDCNAKETVS